MKYGLLTIVIAIAVNSAIRPVAFRAIDVPAEFWPLGWEAVITSTVVAALCATIVYGGITRVTRRPNRAFTIVTALVLLLSFGSFIVPPPVFVGTSMRSR